MMRHILLRLVVVTLCASLTAMGGGCVNLGKGTQETTKFYVLHSMSGLKAETQTTLDRDDLTIGVGPVKFPPYLDRPQIVTRTSPNELDFATFAWWAEPLDENFSSVLAENLSVLLSMDAIEVYPWTLSVPVDYQVTMNVTRFDGTPGGDVSLKARWAILGDDGNEVLLSRTSSFIEHAGKPPDYEAIVSAQSRVVEALSHDIAMAIKAIEQGAPLGMADDKKHSNTTND